MGAVFGHFMYHHVFDHYHASGNNSQLSTSITELFARVPALNLYQRDDSRGLPHQYLKLMFLKPKSYFSIPILPTCETQVSLA